MDRRTLLKRVCQTLGVAIVTVVAVPITRFIIAPLRKNSSGGATTQKIARLDQLPTGVPKQFPILGNRQDAWTLHPSETIGRVWLTRKSEADTPPEKVEIEAFSAVCPHLGCTIEHRTTENKFECPCHKAVFNPDGSKAKTAHHNPSPRNMDQLNCRVVKLEGTEEWWVEVDHEKFQMGLTEKVPV